MVGAGRFERPTPCAQGIGCPHLGINRFNNLRNLLVGPCGNFSYNLDCKAAIRLVKPPDDTNWKSCRKCRLRNQSTWARTCCYGRVGGRPVNGRFQIGRPPAFAADVRRGCRMRMVGYPDRRLCGSCDHRGASESLFQGMAAGNARRPEDHRIPEPYRASGR